MQIETPCALVAKTTTNRAWKLAKRVGTTFIVVSKSCKQGEEFSDGSMKAK